MTTPDPVSEAVRVLRAGGLVAFPTETVYGLGADATNPRAVRRIFDVKGRPASHPLIVHVGAPAGLQALARRLSGHAERLAERLWPGPLTLVVEKSEKVPGIVTGGRDTVGVRVPRHPLALELLRALDQPVAAPSANRFGRVSPTTAAHVRSDLGPDVDLVLDGGAAEVGVESTIVDVTTDPVRVLRLGGVAVQELEAEVGSVVLDLHGTSAPGQLPSHYAPRAEVIVVQGHELGARADALGQRGARVAALAPEGVDAPREGRCLIVPKDPAGYARRLYAALRELDSEQPDILLVVLPDEDGLGHAVADRVRRASVPRSGSDPATR